MARWSIKKHTQTRWEPRINQTFACVDGDAIYEGKRREYVDDERMPFVFRNRNQVRTAQAYISSLLELRKKYTCPELGDKYVLIKADNFSLEENFWANIFDWYLYENWFILSTKVPSEEFAKYVTVVSNYLRTVEDLYIDEYWKSKFWGK